MPLCFSDCVKSLPKTDTNKFLYLLKEELICVGDTTTSEGNLYVRLPRFPLENS